MQRAATTWSHSPHYICSCVVMAAPTSPLCALRGEWGGQQAARRTHGRVGMCNLIALSPRPSPPLCPVLPAPHVSSLLLPYFSPLPISCAPKGGWAGQRAVRRTHGRRSCPRHEGGGEWCSQRAVRRTHGRRSCPRLEGGGEWCRGQAVRRTPDVEGQGGEEKRQGGCSINLFSLSRFPPLIQDVSFPPPPSSLPSPSSPLFQTWKGGIPLASYRLTWKGRVVGGGGGGREGGGGSGDGGMEMNARRVVGMGISVNISTPPMHSPHLSATAPLTHPPHIAPATPGGDTAAAGGDFCPDGADVESDAFPVHGEGPFRLEVAWVKAVRDGA
ncbi:unnamed protein product [Closterium sp. NIES-65]|nr:unnamed protein product [Closterium sp. NIES-65]CAI6010079.1 unnamed protein product [Closterium sp. NIES-65]